MTATEDAALPPLIPLEDFFDNPERAAATISPDGRRVAYLAPEEGRLNVWVKTLGADDAVCVTHDHVRGISIYGWLRDSRRLVYLQDNGGDEQFHAYLADTEAPQAASVDLTPVDGARVGSFDLPFNRRDVAIVALNERNPALFDAYEVDLSTGERRLIGENPGNIGQWISDADGRIVAAGAQTASGETEIVVPADGGFRSLKIYANEDDGTIHGVDSYAGVLWVGSAEGTDKIRLVALDMTTGEEREVAADPDADLDRVLVSARTGKVLGAGFRLDRLRFVAVDDAFGQGLESAARLSSGDPALISMSDDERRWVVSFDDDRDPGATYFLDLDSSESEFLFRPRPKLDPEQLVPMQPVQVTSRDGLTLRCYLSLPQGGSRDLPMVLLVHGGPWARDQWGYHPEAQFLANRGYAVLQVNYRGSSGLGKAFQHAAEHEFAGKMHDDLIDAVEWAIAQGYADQSRVAIYGGSYGGYATLVGVTFTPEVFAAAVDYVGPSSLVTLIRSFPPYWRPFMEGSWFRYVGDPGTEEEPNDEVVADLLARSPITKVDQIRTPLLVVQGANDPRVTQLEADQLVAALRARGVDVEYILKEDEGHGFANPENRLELYGSMERFLARHLGGRTTGD